MRIILLLLLLLLFPTLLLLAQDKKKQAAKDEPKILFASPLGVRPGVKTKVVLRGLNLDKAKATRLVGKGTVKLLKKGTAGVPNQQEADRVGNTQVEVEITLPSDATGESFQVNVETPAGTSKPHSVLIDRVAPVAEKEPNDGFKQAQKVSLGQTIEGKIDRPQDVDVYRFEGKAGQTVVLEVFAGRLGTALDSFLTLHDQDGQTVEMNDDIDGGSTTDSRIEVKLKKTGTYFVTVSAANDQGGPAHVYRLQVKTK
jgi:hypothetical protein